MFLAQLVEMRSPLPTILLWVKLRHECARLPRPYLFAALLTASGAPLPHQTRNLSNLLAAAAPAGIGPAVRAPSARVGAVGDVLGGSSEVGSQPSRGGHTLAFTATALASAAVSAATVLRGRLFVGAPAAADADRDGHREGLQVLLQQLGNTLPGS